MVGATLALAAAFAVTITVETGRPLVGALLFPVGFCTLYLLGFDLLTGVFTLVPLAMIDKRPGVKPRTVLRNWGLVFVGDFAGALTVALIMAIILTYAFTVDPNAVGQKLGSIGASRTVGYADHGGAGMLTLFLRGVLCNWMVSTGVVGAMVSKSVSGKVERDPHRGRQPGRRPDLRPHAVRDAPADPARPRPRGVRHPGEGERVTRRTQPRECASKGFR